MEAERDRRETPGNGAADGPGASDRPEAQAPTPGPWSAPAPVRAVFLDVDGTLLSLVGDREPESARKAVRRLRAAGVLPILATGRTGYLLEKIDLEPFAGLVTFNGQLVEVGGEVLHSNPLDPGDVAVAVRQTLEGRYNCLFMERGRMYAARRDERVRRMEELTHNRYEAGDPRWALENDVYQLNLFVDPGKEGVLLDRTRSCKSARWSDVFADILPASGGKDAGARIAMEALGLRPEECVAFGDGGNDIDLFGLVGTSVAMGDGNAAARKAATYVTEPADGDGIWNACARLGLLG